MGPSLAPTNCFGPWRLDLNSPPSPTHQSVQSSEALVDPDSSDVTQLLADLQIARAHLNRAIDILPRLTIGDQSRRYIEAHVAVLKVRLMQLLDEL